MNLIAVDQEDGIMVMTADGISKRPFDINELPRGGGIVVGDGNVWGIRNERSRSQYCWNSADERTDFISALKADGYRAEQVSNKLAGDVQRRSGLPSCDAVLALHAYAAGLVARNDGRFDSGHNVRESRGVIASTKARR